MLLDPRVCRPRHRLLAQASIVSASQCSVAVSVVVHSSLVPRFLVAHGALAVGGFEEHAPALHQLGQWLLLSPIRNAFLVVRLTRSLAGLWRRRCASSRHLLSGPVSLPALSFSKAKKSPLSARRPGI